MSEQHVIPRNDAIGHEPDETCACSPNWIPVPDEYGGIGWIAVRHSLDGRERSERNAD